MKWWYEPQKDEYKWDSLEEVAFAIASTCRFKIDSHRLPNYYIYNDNGLYDVIKGSELDPYNIKAHNWSEEQIKNLLRMDLREKDDCIEELEFFKAIILRNYMRNDYELMLIAKYIEKIEKVI